MRELPRFEANVASGFARFGVHDNQAVVFSLPAAAITVLRITPVPCMSLLRLFKCIFSCARLQLLEIEIDAPDGWREMLAG